MTFDFFSALLLVAAIWFLRSHRRASLEIRTLLERQRQDATARHAELLQTLAQLEIRMEQAEARQMERNAEQLAGVLHDVVSDLQQRVVAGFETQLARLTALAAGTAELAAKQRNEQMEAMHHVRRLASQMDQATREFGGLLAEGATLARLAGDVRTSLDLLTSRQDAADSGMAKHLETLHSLAESVAALRPALDEFGEQLASQTRRALDAMSQRSALALSKELAESLGKATAGINKQLAAIVPLAQPGKRVGEPPRMAR